MRHPYTRAAICAAICAVASLATGQAQTPPPVDAAAAMAADDARTDYKANDMLNKGMELLEAKQTERAVKLISSVPEMFPKSKVRFRAYLALGQHLRSVRQFDLAIRQYAKLAESDDPEEQAEGLYQIGICHYDLSDFDKAFVSLRRVTVEYPWSVFANESYYYIGQCHFKLGRWGKAIEALEMVGTSVEPNTKTQVFAEAGQRLYVKVFDKDLVVLQTNGKTTTAVLSARSGDKETIKLEPLGRTGEYYIGSIQTTPGSPKPDDGVLQISGRDLISVDYRDQNTEAGQLNLDRIAQVQMVSTASAGFTDGAYHEYTSGVFGDNPAFIRVKDLDLDTTDKPDTLTVRVIAQYKAEREQPAEKTGVELEEEPQWVMRDNLDVQLTETGGHTGIFCGTVLPKVVAAASDVKTDDNELSVMKGDDIIVSYQDETHAMGPDPRTVSYKAQLLLGQIQDVKIEQRIVDSVELKARKDLIEARIFLKLGMIFKEVGLLQKASEKADEGLLRVDSVIAAGSKASLDRALIEEAFSVKWELLLVQDKLSQAIAVCETLTAAFPDSSLVDRALLKIGMARMEGDKPYEAVGIFAAVIRLPKSDLKAEAQYHIAEVTEKMAVERAGGNKPDLSGALLAYRKCAEEYPGSSFAGDSLEKVANYYITSGDYARAIELMERVVSDYPDASFLDRMLLKWVVAAYRMGDYDAAKARAQQLLSEYPNSKSAEKAQGFLEVINRKAASSEEKAATAQPEKP